MSIGIVSNDDFEKELEVVHNEIKLGRNSAPATPEIIREIIAEAAIAGAPAKEIARDFGVSPSSVSAYKNGATSTTTYNQPNESLKKHNDLFREQIIGTARQRLMMALNGITEDKLIDAKPRDLAGIAKDMSSVINNISPQAQINQQTNAQFIFHSYPNKQESDYEVIDVVQ